MGNFLKLVISCLSAVFLALSNNDQSPFNGVDRNPLSMSILPDGSDSEGELGENNVFCVSIFLAKNIMKCCVSCFKNNSNNAVDIEPNERFSYRCSNFVSPDFNVFCRDCENGFLNNHENLSFSGRSSSCYDYTYTGIEWNLSSEDAQRACNQDGGCVYASIVYEGNYPEVDNQESIISTLNFYMLRYSNASIG